MSLLRADLQVIADLVPENAKVLDVGCGNGDLLSWLVENKNVDGRGIELSLEGVNRCIARGLSVVQGDGDADLQYYPDGIYDYVILSQTLQALRDPRAVLLQLARIGKHAIVSVPNFGHWKNRFYLGLKGRMPVTRALSYQWYDTPNIHFCTITDFVELCERESLVIEQRLFTLPSGEKLRFVNKGWIANLFGQQGVFLIRKG